MKYLNLKEQPQLEIALPGGSVILTRRHVPQSAIAEYDAKIDQLRNEQIDGKIDFREYAFQMLEHLTSDFKREDFAEIDGFGLRDIVGAINQLNLEARRATEKKTV